MDFYEKQSPKKQSPGQILVAINELRGTTDLASSSAGIPVLKMTSTLPGILQDIERIAGRQVALNWARQFAGSLIYVSHQVIPYGLAELPAPARRYLQYRFPGCYLSVPSLTPMRQIDQGRVSQLKAEGIGITEIARRLRATKRGMQRAERNIPC